MKSKRISERKHGDFVTALYLNHMNTSNIHFYARPPRPHN